MNDYPAALVDTNHVAPVPRRIRAVLGGATVLDTTRALYVWEWPNYPQFYVPVADVLDGSLIPEGVIQNSPRGKVELHTLEAGANVRKHAAKVLAESSVAELNGTVRFEWDSLDEWYEEDERIFVHPRNPYTRVDTLRSTRHLRVELEGTTLAESSSPVLLFETGLPTRYYFNRTEVDFSHLVASSTVTSCPYKGTTTGYWSVRLGETTHPDLAWSYDFPLREVLPIAGLIAFYNEKVDLVVDGKPLERPQTHFSGRRT
jgi:uncharacterized protein (DUF427 family)